ncbi:MAG: hypothetical protein R2794_03890 [Chitinophagales bacterium]
MENNTATHYPPSRSFLSPASFVIAALAFFLSFADINCNGTKWISVSGMELATGFATNDEPSSENNIEKTEKFDPNVYAINAWLAAILGTVFYFFRKLRNNYMLITIIGFIGFICLILLYFDLRSGVVDANGKDTDDSQFNIQLELEMKLGYFLALAGLFAGTMWNFLQWRTMRKRDDMQLFPEDTTEQETQTG